jgi:hypothetical protein
MKEVSIVYDSLKRTQLLYEGPEGRVFFSPTRNANTHNVFQSYCRHPNPNDSYLMLEPIVVASDQYNIEYLSKFKYIFGCFDKVFQTSKIKDKYIYVNYGSDLKVHSNMLCNIDNWKSWDQRHGMIIIAGGNKQSQHPASIYSIRIMIADLFYENNFDVVWYGQQHLKRPYYKGPIEDKVTELDNYRFAICSENTYDPVFSHSYLTEKFPHALYGGAVPLYMGCYNIDELAPKNTFFDLRKFVTMNPVTLLKQPLLEAITAFGKTEFEQYQTAARQFITDPMGINYHIDPNRVYKKMLEIL